MSTLWNFFGIFKISLKMTNEESSHSLIFLFSLSQIHVLGIVGMIICDFLRLHSLNLALVNFRNSVERNGNNNSSFKLLYVSFIPIGIFFACFHTFHQRKGFIIFVCHGPFAISFLMVFSFRALHL